MSKPPGPITRSLLAPTDGLARSVNRNGAGANSSATAAAGPVPERTLVVVLGDDLAAEFPLDQRRAREVGHGRRGRHVLVTRVKVLVIRGWGRRQRWQVAAAARARTPERVRASAPAVRRRARRLA